MEDLIREYKDKKGAIKARLKDFDKAGRSGEEDIFEELCFCILTPQSKAVNCDRAIRELRGMRLFSKGDKAKIGRILRKHVRFHNNKAIYILKARKKLKENGRFSIKDKLLEKDIQKTREWFVSNIKGISYKEASHFLRNVGLGGDIAIIDRHILRNLVRLKVLKNIPKTITKKSYIEIEEKVRRFSKRVGIPLEEIDLLFWSKETGFIFK